MADEAMSPVLPITIARKSNYGDARTLQDCGGVRACVTPFHPGVDLTPPNAYLSTHGASAAGYAVQAPFDGWLLFAGRLAQQDGQLQGWLDGYGPGVVLLAHDDASDPGWGDWLTHGPIWDPPTQPRAQAAHYTLLAHVDPLFDIPLDPEVRKLERGAPDRSNWRTNVISDPPKGATRGVRTDVMTYQPGGGRTPALPGAPNGGPLGGRYVKKGTMLGTMRADLGHTHWEVRTTPLASPGPLERGIKLPPGDPRRQEQQRIDPWGWLGHYIDLAAIAPADESVFPTSKPPPRPRGDGGLGLVIIAGLVLLASEDRSRRGSRW